MTDKQIREHLEKVYNIDVSPDLISRVTDEVLDEVKEWYRTLVRAALLRNPMQLSIWTNCASKAVRTVVL